MLAGASGWAITGWVINKGVEHAVPSTGRYRDSAQKMTPLGDSLLSRDSCKMRPNHSRLNSPEP